jgi:ubiquinone/menaquinone biosynthesis C-methylase UbiE
MCLICEGELRDKKERRPRVATQLQAPDLATIKERQQKAWSSGDYGRPGATLLIIGELLCEAVDLRPGHRVLDVATGNGNTALAAARRFCEVTGVDYVPALLQEGRERAVAEGLRVDFQEGDAENIPVPNASFDFVLSTIGIMFAPDQEKAASELLRVCRPGGKIGLASWTPDGFLGEFFRTIGKHVPPPPGLKPPFLWGTEERLRELFGEHIDSLQVSQRSFIFRYPSAQYYVEFMRSYYGPFLKALEALDAEGQKSLVRDVVDLINRFNRSGDETAVWPADYLEAVATRR